MPATFKIDRYTGASGSPTTTDITGINTRLNAEDNHTTGGTSNSILIPTSGTNYSFWAVIRARLSAITAGTVNNLRWYTDGANSLGTGVTCKAQKATSYVQATGTTGTTGNQLTTAAYSTLAATPVDAFSFTSAAPLTLSGSATATGAFGDYVAFQNEVSSTAAGAATGSETATWKYDDTSS